MKILLVLFSKGMFSDIVKGVTSKIFHSLSHLQSLPSAMSIFPLTCSLYNLTCFYNQVVLSLKNFKQ